MKIPPRSTDYVEGRVALALGTMDRRLFRYGRTAPLTPMTTPARRSHHPRPGPQDQVTPGDGWAVPQKPPIVNVPTSVVAGPGMAPMSWTATGGRLMDQRGRASDRRTKGIARRRAKPDDSIWRSIWSFVRRRVAVAINPPQRGRWIKKGRTRASETSGRGCS